MPARGQTVFALQPPATTVVRVAPTGGADARGSFPLERALHHTCQHHQVGSPRRQEKEKDEVKITHRTWLCPPSGHETLV